jgi:thymidylate kinase
MIIIIEGPAKSGKTTIANALRNSQIGQGKGALLIDEDQNGELRHQIEKIMDGKPLPNENVQASELKWKSESMVIVVNAKQSVLNDIEAMVPGFKAIHSPVVRLNVSL